LGPWGGQSDYFLERKGAFQTNKKAHRLHLGSAAQIDPDAFRLAVGEMKRCFPDDPSLLLLELHGALAKQDLKGTLEAVNALERRVKKDSHLDIIRARSHLIAGDPTRARPFAARAVDAEPDFAGAWWLLVEVCLAQKDFKAVAETLSKIEEKLELEIGDLESSPPYAEFVKSKEYRHWSKARRR
jgi:predicted Zn-dependent protease